jgi:endonuclease YncB( thermonuclease family)
VGARSSLNLRCLDPARSIWVTFLTAVFVLNLPLPARSAEDRWQECASASQIQARVVRIINSQVVETATGLRIRLAAIEAPNRGTSIKSAKNQALVRRAHKLLVQLTLNKPVSLVFDARKPDRYGRMIAHVFIPTARKPANRWVQAAMIKQGLARAFPNTNDASCIKQLLQLEKEARTRKTGLWNNRFYRVVEADDLKYLNRSLGRLHLVEGRVQSVSVRSSRSYINFSKDWSRDFTVTLDRRAIRLFKQSGIDIKKLTGKNIRVRGWLGRHNGPTIKAYHVAQIEILRD